jgi:hypothetical protein
MADKVTNDYILGLSQAIGKISLEDADVKTAYWLSRNMRLLSPTVKAFEALRTELTSTAVFKQFQAELEAAAEDAKAAVQEKYKQVIADADKELQDFARAEGDAPAFVKLAVDEIAGLKGKDIVSLFDLIEEK